MNLMNTGQGRWKAGESIEQFIERKLKDAEDEMKVCLMLRDIAPMLDELPEVSPMAWKYLIDEMAACNYRIAGEELEKFLRPWAGTREHGRIWGRYLWGT